MTPTRAQCCCAPFKHAPSASPLEPRLFLGVVEVGDDGVRDEPVVELGARALAQRRERAGTAAARVPLAEPGPNKNPHGIPRGLACRWGFFVDGWFGTAVTNPLFGLSGRPRQPHAPPPEGFLRTIDQTRGLLRYVEERYPGAYHPDVRYLTVGSRAVTGKVGTELGGALALASYLPLCGDAFAEGDGITPIGCAHLDGAEQRDVDAYHIAFVPGSGTRLQGTPWYGSPQIIDGWADFLQ